MAVEGDSRGAADPQRIKLVWPTKAKGLQEWSIPHTSAYTSHKKSITHS